MGYLKQTLKEQARAVKKRLRSTWQSSVKQITHCLRKNPVSIEELCIATQNLRMFRFGWRMSAIKYQDLWSRVPALWWL